jgi:hypothetical protein
MTRPKSAGTDVWQLVMLAACLSVLAVMILPNLIGKQRSGVSPRTAHLYRISNAIKQYYIDYEAFPFHSLGSERSLALLSKYAEPNDLHPSKVMYFNPPTEIEQTQAPHVLLLLKPTSETTPAGLVLLDAPEGRYSRLAICSHSADWQRLGLNVDKLDRPDE